MNDPSAFVYEESPGGRVEVGAGAGGGNNLGQYKFSPDEMRVLQDCNRESFFQRSVPISTVLGLGTVVAVQRGLLKPNPRFGAFPKVTLAVAVGYFLGKLSYQQACAEKLMALPGSYIGQLLRDRRDGKIGGTSLPGGSGGGGGSAMFGAAPDDIYSDAGPGSSLDLDTDRPAFSDDTPHTEPHAPPAPPQLSYDDLRQRNRGTFSETKRDPYRVDPPAVPRPTRPPPPTPTNKYGDALD